MTMSGALLAGFVGNFAPVAIRMTAPLAIMAFGSAGGTRLSPARTLGPAVALDSIAQVLPYFGAKYAVAAALLERFVGSARPGAKEREDTSETAETTKPAF
ncbi:hypothetical protein RDV64_17870 [Acuticoccus sp. MNP-M23]|uniref:hypothetical protein n=1 Tax=Acuticoccus sp. MNP-M23 TaxID=3072793 RepID=UPI002814E933|nr:hypothetical protein [Acuticoccus sp. MNP-M23]WMS41916.1 hypothetical protein RDV64_17870 [Acuticoccus sp. MNP-M23]